MDGNTLTLEFSDFWEGFEPHSSFLCRVLRDRWSLEITGGAQILVYGPFGRRSYRSVATKVLCLGEPIPRPFRASFDYSIGWHLDDDDHHVRVPLGIWHLLENRSQMEPLRSRSFDEWAARPYFCNFIYSNPRSRERREFFHALSKRRFVHAPGVVETNTDPVPGGRWAGDWRQQKIEYQRQFRFTISFENAALPGYTSEKIVDALLSGTIPIYWGNPEIGRDVNVGSFIDAADFNSWDDLAQRVIQLDDDRELSRAFFEEQRTLLIDLDEVGAAITSLFERASRPTSRAGRSLRHVRPLLVEASRVRRIPARIGDRLPHNRSTARTRLTPR